MTNAEEQVIRNVIARLRCLPRNGDYRECDTVRVSLTGSVDPHGIMTPGKREVVRRSVAARGYQEHEHGAPNAYLSTWVIGALECLLPEGRDVKLAKGLSE